jgi:hypothetical protein
VVGIGIGRGSCKGSSSSNPKGRSTPYVRGVVYRLVGCYSVRVDGSEQPNKEGGVIHGERGKRE